MNKKREYSFDILRVISMIMVVIIHVSNTYSRAYGTISNVSFFGSLVFNTISRISVPIFLMISGALLLDRKYNKKKYISRLKKYIILIVSWDIIYLIWEKLFLKITYHPLHRLIIEPYRAHLWFLYTIIILYALQPIIKKILDKSNTIIKVSLLVIWIFFSTISIMNAQIAQYFTIFSYMGYFIIGKYIYEYSKKKNIKKYIPILWIIILLSITGSIQLNYHYSIKKNMFYNLFFAYRTPFIMIASILFFIIICQLFKEKKENKIILKISDCSLGVYLIHGIFLDIIGKIWNYKILNSFIGIPIASSIIFICSITMVFLLRKNKIKKQIL